LLLEYKAGTHLPRRCTTIYTPSIWFVVNDAEFFPGALPLPFSSLYLPFTNLLISKISRKFSKNQR
jgi:hypothetical protein